MSWLFHVERNLCGSQSQAKSGYLRATFAQLLQIVYKQIEGLAKIQDQVLQALCIR